MILIADSGSTKTNWFYSKEKTHADFFLSNGINPFFMNSMEIQKELQKNLLPRIDQKISKVLFYGAGIVNKEKGEVVKIALKSLFPKAKIEVESDLLAAARATLGNKEGIACILGTGSNSCLFNGVSITEHVSPLGFILGDEGSGAIIGKKIVGDYLKGLLPKHLSRAFQKMYPLDYADFLEGVYKKDKPSKFLAQFVPFVKENLEDSYCSCLIEDLFEAFVNRNVLQYTNAKNVKINFVGSVAFHFKDQLKSVLIKNGLQPGKIVQDPMEGLVGFHLKE